MSKGCARSTPTVVWMRPDLVRAPRKVWRLRYQWPYRENGEQIESEWTTPTTRYYLTRQGLDHKVFMIEKGSPSGPGRILSIDEGTIDWMAPDGHGY